MRKSTQNLSRKTPGEPRIITRIVQGHNRGPKNAKMPLGSYNHGFRVANTPTGEASGELTLLTKVGRRHERDGRKEGREAKGGTGVWRIDIVNEGRKTNTKTQTKTT